MLKVLKFGGSSMADEKQFAKVRDIVRADDSRRVVVVSAAGKREKNDHKITDLLYLCHAHLQYGVSCDGIYDMIRSRYVAIRDALGLKTPLEAEFAALREKMDKGISADELVSRGEYFAAELMADYLGFDFLDSSLWLKFKLDGTVDQEASYENLRRAASGRRVVIPGFYGAMPDGSVHTFSRGGSDITGALAAAALGADVYENWTDVSGILMADPRIVDDPEPIRRVTYSELRELSYIGAQVLHEGTIFPVREKNIPLNIRNTNEPDHPGTLITESFVEAPNPERFVTGIAGKCDFSIVTVSKKGLSGAVGTLLNVKPVVAAEDGLIVQLGKARGSKNGRNLLNQKVEKAGGVDFSMPLALGYTGLSDAVLKKYIEDSAALWAGHTEGELPIHTIGATIGTHVGPGAVAVAFFRPAN